MFFIYCNVTETDDNDRYVNDDDDGILSFFSFCILYALILLLF